MKRIIIILIAIFLIINVFADDKNEIIKSICKTYADFEKSIETLKLTQIMTIEGVEDMGDVNMDIFKKGDKIRINMNINIPEANMTMTNIIIDNGKEAYIYMPMMGKKKLEGKDNNIAENVKANFWWNALNDDNIVIDKEETIDGKKYYILKKHDDNVEQKHWINKKNKQMLKSIIIDGDNTTIINYKDYKKVANVEIPHLIEIISKDDNKKEDKIIIKTESMEINIPLDDALFDIDKMGI